MANRNSNLVVLVEGAIIAAVAMVLSWIPIEAPNAAFDLSLGLVPPAAWHKRQGEPDQGKGRRPHSALR